MTTARTKSQAATPPPGRLDAAAARIGRSPLRTAIIGIIVCLLGTAGLLRWSVDPGSDLLVGGNSQANQTYQKFAADFGADPMVVVFTAKSPTAFFLERNLQRLTALEDDLAHDPDVVSVMGPGTIARSSLNAAIAFKDRVSTEYPLFVGEYFLELAVLKGETDQGKLTQIYSDGVSFAQRELAVDALKGTADAEVARETVNANAAPTSRLLDAGERAADEAAAKDMPTLFAQYLAGPRGTPDSATAKLVFGRLTAAYGLCDATIAGALKVAQNCQGFFERVLLDLPHCPTLGDAQAATSGKGGGASFCPPKQQWRAVFPSDSSSSSGGTDAVITVRLTARAAADPARAAALRDKINIILSKGLPDDAYMTALKNGTYKEGSNSSAAADQGRYQQLKQLGPLQPTECAGETPPSGRTSFCITTYHDAPITPVIAAASLLAGGVVHAMTLSLLLILPFVAALMLIVLLAFFRVTGWVRRVLPLVSAVLATGFVVGLSLLTGTPLTPATLAALPVLVGLGVDYAVQMVARYDEVRIDRGRDEALARALTRTGPATATAAAATLVGALALAIVAGVDAGPLTAVPLIAEFAVAVAAGVVVAWVAAAFIALPLTVVFDTAPEPAPTERTATSRRKTAAAAKRERDAAAASANGGAGTAVLVLATLISLAGWLALPHIRIETDPQHLLAPGLSEQHDIATVQSRTGYSNEVDIFVTGQVAGPYQQAATVPQNVIWLCQATAQVRSEHSEVQVATSIADVLVANAGANGGAECAAPSPSSPSPSPAPSASPSSPAVTSSPTSDRGASGVVPAVRVGDPRDATGATETPAPGATGSAPASTAASPTATPSGAGSPSTPPQSSFLCDLRSLPLLSRNLVMPIAATTLPCPAIDKFRNTFIGTDTTPIDPAATRIVIGIGGDVTSVADEARLVDSLRSDFANPPNDLRAEPTGLAVLAASAYDTIGSHAYMFNLVPLLAVGILLLLVYREPRRALLPLLPTALAAGWSPLVVAGLGLLPGGVGRALGAFSPLTVVMGALVIALATEFGVVVLSRFVEARGEGNAPEAAAAIARGRAGRAVIVSAATLAGGFAILALSAFVPGGMPLLSTFGLSVLIDLALAVVAVFGVMLPLAVRLESASPRWTDGAGRSED